MSANYVTVAKHLAKRHAQGLPLIDQKALLALPMTTKRPKSGETATPKEVTLNGATYQAFIFLNLYSSGINRNQVLEMFDDPTHKEKMRKTLDEIGAKGKLTAAHIASRKFCQALRITQDARKVYDHLKSLDKIVVEPETPFPNARGGNAASDVEDFGDFSFDVDADDDGNDNDE